MYYSSVRKRIEKLEKQLEKLKKNDDVPEHVKDYGKYNRTYKSTSANKMRSWF